MAIDWKPPWGGGCRCGRVRFKVTQPPLLTWRATAPGASQ